MKVGVGQGFPFPGGFDENGEHDSNPLASRSHDLNWPGFQGLGGLPTAKGAQRSRVNWHGGVDRQPFIAHPLSGPGKSSRVEET